jgi:hypothetical protein
VGTKNDKKEREESKKLSPLSLPSQYLTLEEEN